MKKEIIITDLSRMHGDGVCIFGIDEEGKPIRPVIPYSSIRESYLFDENGQQIIKPFVKIEFDLRDTSPEPPHTEDWEINTSNKPRLIGYISEEDRIKLLGNISDGLVKDIFGAKIHEKRYTNPGEGRRSLGTIKVAKILDVNYSLKEEGKYQYRITFSDISGEIYNLPITDCAFREYCDAQRIRADNNPVSISDELRQKLNQSELFLCIGLTRLFRDVHWLQVSGLHAFPDYREIEYGKQVNMELAYQVLRKYFGYTSFLPLQEEIIKDILLRKDVFVLMPTGGGKSLCYQLPSLLLDGVTIVVSPLIALMKDQVDGLKANGITAAYINSSLSFEEIKNIKTEIFEKKISILYMAPERIVLPNFLSFLHRLNISLIAIDEAHCISEWGHDFRPGYRQLKLLKENFPRSPLIAMTATAIPEVQEDIIVQLRLANPNCYKASLNRENLFYQVEPKDNAYHQLLKYLKNHDKGSGIIYRSSRKSADDLANKLEEEGFRVLPYHAGLNADLRTEAQNKFVEDDIEIIVATIAFGMGIDKPNIRFVIHYDLPKNLETYYQETGRAGRDGENSDCILFYNYGDKRKIEYFIEQKVDENEKRIAYKKLRDMVNFCESRTCRRNILLNYFGEAFDKTNCENCDICLNPKETIDGTIIVQKIISCISQLNERFGMSYIADVLCGSKNKKITANRHNTLTTYGIGKEYPKKQWQAFIRELIHREFLKTEGDKYPVVKILNQNILDHLFDNDEILLTKPAEEARTIQEKTSTLQETLELCKQNLTILEIAPKRNLAISTIASHIEKLILSGEEIPINKFVDINKQEDIMKMLSILGSEKLKPIKEKLGDDYTYEEIRLVRAYKMRNSPIDQQNNNSQ